MHHMHTDEDISITYKRDGRYDEAALEKLNWFLRDWRRGEEIRMDPHLIDLVWEVHRETGSKEPVWVVCGYRSPETNAMLRRRSSGVARFSQHMLGHAMDFYIPGVPLEALRVIGLRLQRGGVGFYPTSGSPFVHMDTGGVRMWPRMTRNQLLHVFPDGRTAYIPTDGRPLPGYALALADIRKRGGELSPTSTVLASNEGARVNPFAELFGPPKQDPDEEDDATRVAAAAPPEPAPPAPRARSQPANALLAALEREAEQKREAARLAADARSRVGAARVADAATKPKLYHTASYAPPPTREAPQHVAALTPNQIIIARGYWEGLPDGETAARAVKPRSDDAPHRKEVASAAPDITAAIGRWSGAHEDRVPPELALAYAEQPERATPATPAAPMAALTNRAIETPANLQPLPAATTIAVKRAANQAASTIIAAPPRLASAVGPGAQVDNPWLGAMVLSPSVRRYLTTLALGPQDYRTLASLVEKPANSVMMTFAANPNPGLTHDHFSGSAIVFVSTVTYTTHTASLR